MSGGICWLAIGDGRDDTHEASLQSARDMLPPPDDFIVIDDSDHNLGYGGAIDEGWRQVLKTDADYVFHLELDFLFEERVPVRHMAALLERRPYLTQVALKRQPVNDEERSAGGVVELVPDQYEQIHDAGYVFTEHRHFGFTTNPCVYPAALCAQGWPLVEHSERRFGDWLLEDPLAHSCYWGGKLDAPRVEHIGVREGTGY